MGLFSGLKKKSLLDKGKNAGNNGDHEEALKYFNQVLEMDPENVDALFNKGCAFINFDRQRRLWNVLKRFYH
ncbi:MAG: tetratricopeptide repeat protein [Methanobacteriaceae archaeon]|nr:tetratricopeptide repeat protein [Methanobacteriaceae archaeon]